MVDIVRNRNCVYQTAYHPVWCPKYRRKILNGPVAQALNDLLDSICEERSWVVTSKKIQPDHLHLFVSLPPSVSIASAVKVFKGVTARRLFQEFPKLRERLNKGHL